VKIITSCVVSAISLLAATGIHAAEADKANVTRIYTDVVEPAHQQAYETAGKNYNKCLGQHGFKYTWKAWTHETGNTYAYSYAGGPYAWADFDKMHETSKACDDSWRTEVNPHLKSETSAFLVGMPELSRMPADKDAKPALINVTLFTLKTSREADDAFTDGVKKITAAAEKSKWSGHFTLYKTRGGDKGSPDYVLVSPYKNWADYGAGPDPSVWKMVESVHGKQETDALRKSLNDALQDVSNHVDNYNADLTYTASSK
jgi:hypothetical protein